MSASSLAAGPAGFSAVPAAPVVIPHDGGERFDRNGFGVNWKIDGDATGGRFSVVHHPLAAHVLAAPLHRHNREDEYSYVLTGTMGALLGDDVVSAGPGTWVFKPRGQWHTFWNAGDTPCELIELISPAGFENFFRELGAVWQDPVKFVELTKRFDLDMRPETVPELCARFGLVI